MTEIIGVGKLSGTPFGVSRFLFTTPILYSGFINDYTVLNVLSVNVSTLTAWVLKNYHVYLSADAHNDLYVSTHAYVSDNYFSVFMRLEYSYHV